MQPLPYSAVVEVIPSDEREQIQQVIETLRALLAEGQRSSGLRQRDVHVKSHGCPHAQFQVIPNLPEELRQGLFQTVRVFPAVMRFSSSSPWPKPDAIPDARGVAIKIQDIQGDFLRIGATDPSAQDFVMINRPAFIAKDVQDYLRIQRARLHAGRRPGAVVTALTGGSWNPRKWRWREMLTTATLLTQFLKHPASQTYYSMVPIRYGDYVAKYRLQLASPTPGTSLRRLKDLATQADAFQLMLAETLRTSDLRLEFQVQLWTSLKSMPIEDASIRWSEIQSSFRTVAHVLIPLQELDFSPQGRGDGLAFSVWNALEAHRPLGGINRVRRAAYETSATWRGCQPPQDGGRG
ncbi:catalase family protein [Planctomicrobium piriforme]|uniref:Catalase n=1 Tax=Planctomicrobium piriforme TaxID=1576369 RepID=A0A1I3S2S8_9PLAN|nr:catalase family protein [Planctomicrobium piriforme]SFJ51899.1 hypothetical protein SAMN05421753_12260 [Planctomicrobium piriforme]